MFITLFSYFNTAASSTEMTSILVLLYNVLCVHVPCTHVLLVMSLVTRDGIANDSFLVPKVGLVRKYRTHFILGHGYLVFQYSNDQVLTDTSGHAIAYDLFNVSRILLLCETCQI